jgi:hypothetical protein
MFLVDHGAFRTLFLRTMKGRAERHPNRNSDAKPDRNVSDENSGDRSQRRS